MQNADLDKMPHSAVSDLGLHCLPNTLFGGFQTKMDLKLWYMVFLIYFYKHD